MTGTTAGQVHAAYFRAAIAIVLTLGASWGAWLLWQIGIAKSFNGISLFEVNAHGHAQIFGWLGLFIMGASWRLLPDEWGTRQPSLRLALPVLAAMVIGIILRTTGMATAGKWAAAVPLTLLGGALEILALTAFAACLWRAFRRGAATLTPANAFILTAVALLLAQAGAGLWHSWATMTATNRDALIWYVATYQAPLRDLQVHGVALFMILGVAMTLFPRLWGVAPTSARRGWWAYGLLLSALVAEIAIFLVYRHSGIHWIAALLLLPWLLLPIGCALIIFPWRLWQPLNERHAGARYIRIGGAWLFFSFLMLLMMPVYQSLSGIAFSHAYYGAVRHAITVGFVSMTMMGMAMRLVDRWSATSQPWPAAPFLLINLGCLLRVGMQVLTDTYTPFFSLVGISGMLEVAALAWWGSAIWRRLRQPVASDLALRPVPQPERLRPDQAV